MVTGLRKNSNLNLSTWGQRGTAGLVEEWEPRRPIPEEKPQSRQRSAILIPESTEAPTEGKNLNK